MELMILKCIKSKLMTPLKKIVASTSDIKNDNNLQNEKIFLHEQPEHKQNNLRFFKR